MISLSNEGSAAGANDGWKWTEAVAKSFWHSVCVRLGSHRLDGVPSGQHMNRSNLDSEVRPLTVSQRIKSFVPLILLSASLVGVTGCTESEGHAHESHHTIIVTCPTYHDVVSTQQYVCQMRSSRHIELCALESGYLEKIQVREGQLVNENEPLFQVVPTLYKARLDTDLAEAQQVQIELDNTLKLNQKNVVSAQEVALVKAKLAKAQAKVELSRAELNFTTIKAPYAGIIDRLHKQQGSLVSEGDVLTTLSDNSLMWVYFNVPEAAYLDYMANFSKHPEELTVELVLANGTKFSHPGVIGAIEADFNNQTGNIPFRADFPNPELLLRHGQTGTILISRMQPKSIVIPQRAVFEILAKRYVYVVDEESHVHQREITIEKEMDDIYLVRAGLGVGEKIVLEGTQLVRDGDHVDYQFRAPDEVLSNLKYHAE